MDLFNQFVALLREKQRVSHREVWVSAAAAFVALFFVGAVSYFLLEKSGVPYIFASMGASAVLIFVIPTSTMNRPWALFSSHILAACIGTTCALYITHQLLAIALAIAAIIVVMHYFRCIHPPGGATALLIVLASDEVHALGYQIVVTPVLLNTLLLIVMSLVIRRLLLGIEPKAELSSPIDWLAQEEKSLTAVKVPFGENDLKKALSEMDTYVDVQRKDLLTLYEHALRYQRQRSLGALRCSELMLADFPSAEFGTELIEVWSWFQEYEVTGIPVIDRGRHVIGIVTLKDFIHYSESFPQEEMAQRIDALIQPTRELTSNKPEVAGQIMSSPAITALENSLVSELLSLLDSHNIRHIPIVDDANKLVGMLSRDQIVAVLGRNNA